MRLPVARTIALLGLVSLLTDVAGEMVQPILPLYLAALGVGAAGIGAVEGTAEAAVSLVKIGSGHLADRAARRKPLVVLGYGLAAVAKPALAFTSGLPGALAARTTDRVGKGVRGAPRDAIIGDLAADGQRGLAFGFHRTADTLGAVIGPLVALALLAAAGQGLGGMRLVFLLTAAPMACAVLVLVLAVRETPRAPSGRGAPRAAFPRAYWAYLAIAGLFTLGNVSYAFWLLRAQNLGASAQGALLLYLLFNVVYALASIPAGRLSDRAGRVPVLAGAFLLFAAASAGLALAPSPLWAAPMFALLGVHAAAYETVSRAYAVDLAPPGARARALGAYFAVTGLLALPAGLLAGALWERVAPSAAFAAGAGLALLAAAGLAALHLRTRGRPAAA